MGTIYKITCTTNGKFYIGSTVNKIRRWSRHRRDLRQNKHPNPHMQAAWNVHGEEAFLFEVIEEVANDAELMLVEQRHLDEHHGKPECFNWNKYADAPMRGKKGPETPRWGQPVSEETRAKISAGLSGENHPNWGKSLPSDTKEKIRASNLLAGHTERRHTPEAKAKIAAASKGRPVSLETRYKRSVALKGHEVSSLTRLKISKTLSGDGNYWYGKKRPELAEQVRKPVAAYKDGALFKEYPSIQHLREDLGLKPPTVNRALKSGQRLTRGPYVGWAFKYVKPL